MYIKVIQGKVNYKDRVYSVGEMLECKKDVGLRLVNAKLCTEVSEDLYKVLTKYNEYKPDIDDIDTDNSNDTKTIDDLRDTL